jgi:putative ABC transport system ATP-binding protein
MTDRREQAQPSGIEARGVSKTYRVGDVPVRALQHVSLSIAPGEFLFVTGRNGAGKSTLLNCLATLEQPDEGRITIDGTEITQMSRAERAALRADRIGYVFQQRALLAELTALENVMLPAMTRVPAVEARRRAQALLERVGLAAQADHLPGQLSGGQQQRTAIARAIANDPAILFVDEPTASLDTTASREVLELFERLNRAHGYTIVMVSHEETDARHAKRFIRMSDGEIVDDRRLS